MVQASSTPSFARRSSMRSPRSAPHPAAGRLYGGLCRFGHAAQPLRRRSIWRRFPGTCEGTVGSRRHARVSRRVGRCPAFRARHGVFAIPADIGARLTAIRDQQGQRKRDAAHGAPSHLQRAGTIALRGRRWYRRRRTRSARKLFRSRFRARRHCGRRDGCLPRRLSAGIGLSEGFWPGIAAAVLFCVAIAGRPGVVIVAEPGEPVAHLGPTVFPGRTGVVLPDLDLHVRSPVKPGGKRHPAAANLPRDRQCNGMADWRPRRVLGRAGSGGTGAAGCGLAGPP